MRTALVATLAVVAVLITGCGSTIKPEGAAKSVVDLVKKQTGFTPTDVKCPEGVEAKEGTKFECTFTGPEGTAYTAGQLLVFGSGGTPTIRAVTASTVMLFGGEPVGPRFIEWNFVSSSRDRIEQAKADWRAGRMKLPDLDHDECVPLPEQTPTRQPGGAR